MFFIGNKIGALRMIYSKGIEPTIKRWKANYNYNVVNSNSNWKLCDNDALLQGKNSHETH